MSGIFREKSVERISSPEQLNDYIRVTRPGIWLILAAVTLLLVGMLIFAVFYSADAVNEDGTHTTLHPITFITN